MPMQCGKLSESNHRPGLAPKSIAGKISWIHVVVFGRQDCQIKRRYFGKRSSRLILLSGLKLARVVVKPIQRPKKMMVIHRTRDNAATVLPARGADSYRSQR